MTKQQDTWVFAYGSLMWDRFFPHADVQPARLYGYHRSLCLYSFDYRGTEDVPGLVLGLDRGGSCRGLAFRIAAKDSEQVMDDLIRRETSFGEYHLRWLKLYLEDSHKPQQAMTAATFVVNRDTRYYAGKHSTDAAARAIAKASGNRGRCLDYVKSTVTQLQSQGIRDEGLEAVLEHVGRARNFISFIKTNCF